MVDVRLAHGKMQNLRMQNVHHITVHINEQFYITIKMIEKNEKMY